MEESSVADTSKEGENITFKKQQQWKRKRQYDKKKTVKSLGTVNIIISIQIFARKIAQS